MSSARPYPPSAQRLAEARAHGQVPRAPVVGVAAVALGLAAGGAWAVASLGSHLRTLARAPLEAAARGHRAEAHALAERLARDLASDLAVWLGAALTLSVAASFAVQGAAFGWPKRPERVAFPSLKPSRTAGFVWLACLLLCAGITAHESVDAPLDQLPSLLGTCAQRAFALTLPCMVVDAAFARARFGASLWLTRRELRDEQRAAFGSELVRAARARLRGEAREEARAQDGAPR